MLTTEDTADEFEATIESKEGRILLTVAGGAAEAIGSSLTPVVFRTIAEKFGTDSGALLREFWVRLRCILALFLRFVISRRLQPSNFGGERLDRIDGVMVPVRDGPWRDHIGQHDVLYKNTAPTKNNPARVTRRKFRFRRFKPCDLCQQPLAPASHAKGVRLFSIAR
jgi:hypothetical protein